MTMSCSSVDLEKQRVLRARRLLRVTKPTRGVRLRHDALGWLTSDADDWLFSFRNICYVLGLEPEFIRRRARRQRCVRKAAACLELLARERATHGLFDLPDLAE